MFIQKLHLKNFKRFTNLVIDLSILNLPSKLVLLIGPNGCGKTCVFDAFEWLSQIDKQQWSRTDDTGRRKVAHVDVEGTIEFTDGTSIGRHNDIQTKPLRNPATFYGRSALRQIPQLSGRGRVIDPTIDNDRPTLYIGRDERFENDIETLTSKIMHQLFGKQSFNDQILKERFIDPINAALQRVFGDQLANKLEFYLFVGSFAGKTPDLRFRKGKSDIHYDVLSNGEKDIINILINLLDRTSDFQDSIYYLDELDLHLNTTLQYALLKEIVENWIPENCQLWTASHSLGFIQYARENDYATIIDFDQKDFDQPQTLAPESKSNNEVYEIAIPKNVLVELFSDRKIIFCENLNARYYNALNIHGRLFADCKDKDTVANLACAATTPYWGLRDRDYVSDNELLKIKQSCPQLYCLHYYCFENYLYHPQNLQELQNKNNSHIKGLNLEDYRHDLIRQKNDLLFEIGAKIQKSRSSDRLLRQYVNEKDRDKGFDAIKTAIKSDEFELFYPFFDMKSLFNRHFLAKYNLSTVDLTHTNWFHEAIKVAISDS